METVTVACKLPNGLVLRVYDYVKAQEPTPGGLREVTVPKQRAEEYVLNGWSHPQNRASHCLLADGYALTMNIPKAFWDKWLEQNKDTDFVRKHLIYAHVKMENAVDFAKEHAKVRSGLERLDPDKLPGKLKKATEKDAA